MIITRKLLLPSLVFFALVLLGMAIIFYANFQAALNEQDQVELQRYAQILDAQINQRGQLAIMLAQQAANQPGIKNVFESQDDNRATILCSNALRGFQSMAPTLAYQFHLAAEANGNTSAFFWLACNYTSMAQDASAQAGPVILPTGTDQTAWRASLVTAITEKRPVSGIELGPDGLLVRGVVPVGADLAESATAAGVVEANLLLDQAFLNNLKNNFGSDWSLLISQQAIQQVNLSAAQASASGSSIQTFQPDYRPGPVEELALQTSTNANVADTIFGLSDAYRQGLLGQPGYSQVVRSDQTLVVFSLPLRDFSGQIIGIVDVVINRTEALAAVRQRLTGILGLGVAALVIGGIGLALILRSLLKPVQELTMTAAAIAQGDTTRAVSLPVGVADDEIKQLFVSFGAMTRQMRALIASTEQRVVERTQELETRSRQLRAAAEIARDITIRSHAVSSSHSRGAGQNPAGMPYASTRTPLETLLDLAAQQIEARFDYYIVSILLTVTESKTPQDLGRASSSEIIGSYAELKAASGQSAAKLLQQRLRIDLSRPGVVSSVINNNQSRIIRDVSQEAEYVRETLLPDTRSEIAVPLRGMAVMQDLGGGRVERAIGALDVQSRQIEAFDENDAAVLQIIADQLANAIQNLALIEQLAQTIAQLQETSGELTQQAWQAYLNTLPQPETHDTFKMPAEAMRLPLRVRDHTIGGIDLVFDSQQPPPEVISLVEEVANRLGLVLESTRLLQEARRLALREQIIGKIAARMRSSLDMDQVMQNAIQEIARIMDMTEVEIRLASQQEEQK